MNMRRVRRCGPFAAFLLMLCGCDLQLPAGLQTSSLADRMKGPFVGTVNTASIDYSVIEQAHAKLEANRVTPSYAAEGLIGPINHDRIVPGQSVVVDPIATRMIQDIIDQLLRQWPGRVPDYRIAIVQDSPEAPFLPEADLDGTMFFGLALVRDLDSTDELAFVVAHETAHVLLAHAIRAATQNKVNSAVQDFKQELLSTGRDAAVSKLLGSRAGLKSNVTRLSSSEQLVLNNLLEPAFSRTQESEADLLGVDLMIGAGYSPRAVGKLMARLEDIEKKTDAALNTVQSQQREKSLQGAMNGVEKNPTQITTSPMDLLHKYFDPIIDQTEQDQLNPLKATHPPALTRDENLSGYMKRIYPQQVATRRRLKTDEYGTFKQADEAQATTAPGHSRPSRHTPRHQPSNPPN